MKKQEKKRVATKDSRLNGMFSGDYYALLAVIPRAVDVINDTADCLTVKMIDYNKEKWQRCVCLLGHFRIHPYLQKVKNKCECIADLLIISRHPKGYSYPTLYCSHCLLREIIKYWKITFENYSFSRWSDNQYQEEFLKGSSDKWVPELISNHDCNNEIKLVEKEYEKRWMPLECWKVYVPPCGDPVKIQNGCSSYIDYMPICDPHDCTHKVHYCQWCVKKEFEKIKFSEEDINWLINTHKYNDITEWVALRDGEGNIKQEWIDKLIPLDVETDTHHTDYYRVRADRQHTCNDCGGTYKGESHYCPSLGIDPDPETVIIPPSKDSENAKTNARKSK